MTVPAEMVTVGSTAACAANAKARKRKRAESFANRDTAIVKKDDIKLLGADEILLT
jgi:hypothetical protein